MKLYRLKSLVVHHCATNLRGIIEKMKNYPQPLPITSEEGLKALKSVKLLCCDIDGVMTDGGMYYGAEGQIMVKFNVLDGMGIKLIQKLGIKTCFITMSNTNIIQSRADVLGIDYCYMGITDKREKMEELTNELSINFNETAHIADDVNDLSLLKAVGCSVTVPNGVEEVKATASFITSKAGGYGAVRELCDCLVKAQT